MSGSSAVGDLLKSLQHATEPPPEDGPACRGDMVPFGKRKSAGVGYLARSARSGPGVLVLHDWFGLTRGVKEMADDLCAEGFTALAPDLYDGMVASSVDEAEAAMAARDRDRMAARLEEAAGLLQANWHPRLGVVGFSMGAFLATRLATAVDLEAAVFYYGLGPIEAQAWRVPLLGHFVPDDPWEPLDEVRAVFRTLGEAGGDADLRVYPERGHWFANDHVRSAYDEATAALAWAATVDHLRHHLA